MPTHNVILNGARGGQGTSTIAAALALAAATHRETHLVVADLAANSALLGIPEPIGDEAIVANNLTLTTALTGEPDVRIIDAGPIATTIDDGGVQLVVLRGPCYVALRTLVHNEGRLPDGIVLVLEPGRSLSARDVEDVTGVPVVATVPLSPAVARTIDAGLLVARLQRLTDLAPLRRYASRILCPEALHEPSSVLVDAPPGAATDLNEPVPASPSKIATDLPVAQCATGRSSQCCRVAPSGRAFPLHADNNVRRSGSARYR
ncbi:MAG: cellulose synthase operon protein YhjQ/BcsQ, partial [Acidimicrobiia bacterium]